MNFSESMRHISLLGAILIAISLVGCKSKASMELKEVRGVSLSTETERLNCDIEITDLVFKGDTAKPVAQRKIKYRATKKDTTEQVVQEEQKTQKQTEAKIQPSVTPSNIYFSLFICISVLLVLIACVFQARKKWFS